MKATKSQFLLIYYANSWLSLHCIIIHSYITRGNQQNQCWQLTISTTPATNLAGIISHASHWHLYQSSAVFRILIQTSCAIKHVEPVASNNNIYKQLGWLLTETSNVSITESLRYWSHIGITLIIRYHYTCISTIYYTHLMSSFTCSGTLFNMT